jgi:hypothetical protein
MRGWTTTCPSRCARRRSTPCSSAGSASPRLRRLLAWVMMRPSTRSSTRRACAPPGGAPRHRRSARRPVRLEHAAAAGLAARGGRRRYRDALLEPVGRITAIESRFRIIAFLYVGVITAIPALIVIDVGMSWVSPAAVLTGVLVISIATGIIVTPQWVMTLPLIAVVITEGALLAVLILGARPSDGQAGIVIAIVAAVAAVGIGIGRGVRRLLRLRRRAGMHAARPAEVRREPRSGP